MASTRPRMLLPTLFSVVILDLIGFGIVIPILPFFAKQYGADAAVLGLLLSTHAGMQFVFAPLWGKLSDRIGRRPVMLFTIAGTAVALALLGLAHSILGLFLARVMSGLFGANISVATAYVSDVTEPHERTRWMGMVGASFGIGFLLGPAIGGLLAPYGLGVPMFTAAGMAVVNCVFGFFVLSEPTRRHPRESESLALGTALHNRLVGQLCLMNFLFTFAVAQLEASFAFFMMDRFDYDARQVAFILVMMAFIMAGIQGGGIRALAARFGEKALLGSGLLLMGLCFATVPSVFTVSVLLIPLAVSAMGRAIVQPPMLSLVSMQAASHERGTVLGTFQSMSSLARVFGPAVAGVLYVRAMGLPFYLGSGLLIATFVAALRLHVQPIEATENAD